MELVLMVKNIPNKDSYKYNNLIAELRRQIFAGNFKAGEKMLSERALAEYFGYSRVTIRTALKQLKEEGLIEQIQGEGTFVNLPEKSNWEKISGKIKLNVCYVCLECSHGIDIDPYHSQIFLGLHRVKSKYPFEFEPLLLEHNETFVNHIIKNDIELNSWDGIIFSDYIPRDEDLLLLETKGIKFVVLGDIAGPRRVNSVNIDNYDGAYQATKHLIDNGCTRPLFLFPQDNIFYQPRCAGYRAALAKNNIEHCPELEISISYKDEEKTAKLLSMLIKQNLAFDSIIVFGDWATIGVINTLKKYKLRIPEDISVIAYDSFTWMLTGKLKPTSVAQPFSRMAEKAAELLYKICCEEGDDTHIIILKPLLQVRESTKIVHK